MKWPIHPLAVGLLLGIACSSSERPILFTSLVPSTPESIYEIGLQDEAPRLLIPGEGAVAINLAVRSPDGRRIAFVREYEDSTHLFVSDPSSRNQHRIGTLASPVLTFPDWAPDGRSLLVSGGPSVAQLGVFLVSVDRQEVVPILADSGLYRCPSWAPDGERFVVSHYLDGQSTLLEVAVSSGTRRILARSDSTHLDCPRWSPQGNEIAFTVYHGGGLSMWERFPSIAIQSSIWLLRHEDGTLRRVTPISSITNYPSWSRDGQWLVFQSDHHAGRVREPAEWDTRLDSLEIYIVRSTGQALRRLTRNHHFDAHPSW